MRTKISNYLLLLSGALFLLAGCDPLENKARDNKIIFDGRTYKIANAGTDFKSAVSLWFESSGDAWAEFSIHLDEGEYSLKKPGTFTFAAEGSDNYGKPGTFSGGYCANETTVADVVSGTIVVDVSGGNYNIKVDCMCENGLQLTVSYIGALECKEPVGTTTFNVLGVKFPYATAWIKSHGMDEDYGVNITNIEIYARDVTGDRGFECYLMFLHSGPGLAGNYVCTTEEPAGAGFVYGAIYASVVGINYGYVLGSLPEGKVKVEIKGDIYTITFDGVKIDAEKGLVKVTGAYTGSVIDRDEDGYYAKYVPAKAERRVAVKSGHPALRLRK